MAALRNEAVLEKIFQFLPMESLDSCSDVCKIWNYSKPGHIAGPQEKHNINLPPCARNYLNGLDEAVLKMAVAAFNSLSFDLKPS